MNIRSLGFRTDLRLLELTGSQIEDRGTHLVIRTPDNPTFFWGNFLLLRHLPTPGGEREVIAAFHTEFPLAEHVAIGVDGTEDQGDDVDAFAQAGVEVDSAVVLTATALDDPRPLAEELAHSVVVRALESDDDWDRRTRLNHRLYPHASNGQFLPFARAKNEQERALVAAGAGARFGAFVGEELLSTAAVFRTEPALARFQSVETDPGHRRQGLAAAVVHAAGRHGLESLGVERLVIVADAEGEAVGLYRRLGFEDTERQLSLERKPPEWT